MTNQIGFKSYCWSIGTTSYRTDKFNMNIEMQLALLKEFRKIPENKGMVVFSRIQSSTKRICSLSSFINFAFTSSAG